MTTSETVGDIGPVEVRITVEGPEEDVNTIATDLNSRADELRQMLVEGIPPEETEKPLRVDWESAVGKYDD